MPDTEKNQSVYPQSGVQKSGLGFPLAMLVGLISLSTGAVLGWALGPCRGKQTGEQALFRHLMPQLHPGDILLADRYHCTYFTVAQLRALGVDLVTRQHQRRITDFQRGKRLGRRDHLIEWLRPKRPPWMTPDTYASMPEKMMLRETEVAGRILVTTFPDPPVRKRGRNRQALRQALAGRGRSPLDQGRDGHGHSSNPDARDGRKGDSVYLLTYKLVCALMSRAAAGSGVQPRSLSFKGTVQLLCTFEQQLRLCASRSARTMTAFLLVKSKICCKFFPVRLMTDGF